jgi:hypothetical protein
MKRNTCFFWFFSICISTFADTIVFEGKNYNCEYIGDFQEYYEIKMDKYDIDSEWLIAYVAWYDPDSKEWSKWEEDRRIPANGQYLNNSKLQQLADSFGDKPIQQINGSNIIIKFSKYWWSKNGYLNATYRVYRVK